MATESINTDYMRQFRQSIQWLQKKVHHWGNKILEIDFQMHENTAHGLLTIPVVLMVIVANLGNVLIPKYDLTEFRLFEGSIDIFQKFSWSIWTILILYFEFLLIMGKTDACTGKNQLFLIFADFFLRVTGNYTLAILEAKCIQLRFENFVFNNNWFFMIIDRVTRYTIVWFQHPKSQRCDPEFQRRYKWFLLYKFNGPILMIGYIQLERIFRKIPNHYQFSFAFVLVGMRYLSTKAHNKVTERARGDNKVTAQVAVACGVGCYHAIYLMMFIGSRARMETTMVYLLIDTLLIFLLFYKTVSKVNDLASSDGMSLDAILQGLTLKETLEILVPICFCPVYILAFLGPNKEYIGVVKHKTIDGMLMTLMKIGGFMVFDGFRIACFAMFLKKKYQISLYKSFCKLMIVYWKLITTLIIVYVDIVS